MISPLVVDREVSPHMRVPCELLDVKRVEMDESSVSEVLPGWFLMNSLPINGVIDFVSVTQGTYGHRQLSAHRG